MDFGAVSWLGALLAGVAFFAFGALWYGPLFGKLWTAETGVTEETAAEGNLPVIFGATLVLEILAAAGLAAILGGRGELSVAGGLAAGIAAGALIVVPVLGVLALYERKSVTLWALNGGYNLVGFAIMGAIIGAFQ